MIIFTLIFILVFIIVLSMCYDNYKEIKELKSLLEYYQWHDGIYDLPTKNSWYLAQTDDICQKIKVLFYDAGTQRWAYDGYVKAWCHLPCLLYHE